jgi:hypothetical protein
MLIGEKPMTGWFAALAAVAVVQPATSASALAAAATRVMCFTNTPWLPPALRFSNIDVHASPGIGNCLQVKSNLLVETYVIPQINRTYFGGVMVSL